ncbi:long-chain fatty-acid--CoA ligase [Gordonia hirsuta DSM 44140 = NBRC 16056]|uniref:Acyl-CoA synthetase n=1 Tax=Gordonia hirsuta DSM 44140 = NBRC 16056 TaxID=1121927 RepID=L7L4Z8_9ACTN|nr:long-chain fatty acid--CoA ligase [Gordonia hirsuta]GAC55846.1 long-chain fatty-acid--CoA ligase [Gordonia hirsuta DSM 44140 = NBRC 16056]
MAECRVPAKFTTPPERNATDVLFDAAAAQPDRPMFLYDTGDGEWAPISSADAAQRVRDLAKGLIASGINVGDRVALMSATRLEWTLLDFAIWSTGATPVPIYDSSSGPQIDWIMEDSAAVAIIVENEGKRKLLDEVSHVTAATTVFTIDQTDGPGLIEQLTQAGTEVTDAELEARRRSLRADSPATLIYTSGTTGRPKGVMLYHSNLLGEVGGVLDSSLADLLGPGKRLLLFLPMAHVLARGVNLIAIEAGVAVGYTADIANLLPTFEVFRPSLILSVPRVFEKVYNSARQKAYDDSPVKGKIFDRAATTAIQYSKALDDGSVGKVLQLRHKLYDRLVYSKLTAALGGQCELAISGGAPLGARLGHFFRGVGIPVYEGYGLTETTAAITVNTPAEVRMGTVGRPIPGNAVRIAPDGEVMLNGAVVFGGYWRNDEATAEAITDGWFHTGDLGSLDEDGFLRITGRKKEIIVTAGGKNVSPAPLEDIMRAHPMISQAMVVGDKEPFIGTLITLDAEQIPGWLERNGKDPQTHIRQLVKDADLHAELQAAIDEANATVSHAEAIKKFRILWDDFTEETGELTPTLKVKRKVVAEKYSQQIEKIYRR